MMKALKYFGFSLLGIIFILLLVSIFLPGKVHLERSLTMKAPVSIIYEQINVMKKWENWNPWGKLDPNIKITYSGPESGVGASYSWVGNDKVGVGKLAILSADLDKSIGTNINFGDGVEADGKFTFEPSPEGTKVTWGFDCDMGSNPVKKFFGMFFLDGFVGADYERGLAQLNHVTDSIMKATPPKPNYEVVLVELTEQPIISIRTTTTTPEIGSKLGVLYGKLGKFAAKNHLKQAGAPLAFYHSYNPTGSFEMEAAVPVDKKAKSDTEVKAGIIEKGQAVMVDYYGPYEGAGAAHDAIAAWLKENKKEAAGSPWETYVTDPMTEKDSSKWLTKIYYRVK